MSKKSSKKSGVKGSAKSSARRGSARANPTGAQVAKSVGMTALAAGVGAGVTLLATRALQMKKQDGTPRLTPNQQMLGLGLGALGLAAGAAAVKPGKIQSALGASAVVAGGITAVNYAHSMRIPQRLEAAVTGTQASAGAYNPMMALPSGDARPGYINAIGQYVAAH